MSAQGFKRIGLGTSGSVQLKRNFLGSRSGSGQPPADTTDITYVTTEYFSKRKPVAKARP
jgi:hypothetical protein